MPTRLAVHMWMKGAGATGHATRPASVLRGLWANRSLRLGFEIYLLGFRISAWLALTCPE